MRSFVTSCIVVIYQCVNTKLTNILAQFNALLAIEKKLVQLLSVFRSNMAAMGESYGQEFLQVGMHAPTPGQVPDFIVMQEQVVHITDPSGPGSFFLHKWNPL